MDLTSHIIAKIKSNMEDALSINFVKSARELLPSEIKYSEVCVKKCYSKCTSKLASNI